MPRNNRNLEDAGRKSVSRQLLSDWYDALIGTPGRALGLINDGGYGGGTWNGAGATGHWTAPEYYYNDIYPGDTIPTQETFNEAFARARKQGLDTFTFNGGTYGTQLGNNPNWRQAGDARVQQGIPIIIPADTIRRRSSTKRDDVIHPKRIGIRR